MAVYDRELSLTSRGTRQEKLLRSVVAMPPVVSWQDSRSVTVDMQEFSKVATAEEVQDVSYGKDLFQHD